MNVSFSTNNIQASRTGNSPIFSIKPKTIPDEVKRILHPEEQTNVPLKLTIRWKQKETANVSLPLTIRWNKSDDAPLSEKNMSQEEIKETVQELPSSKRKRIEDPAQAHVAAKRPRVEVNQIKTISKLGEIEKNHFKSKEVKRLAHSPSEENIPKKRVKQETPNIRDTKFLEMITTNALAPKKRLSLSIWTLEDDQKLLAGVELHGNQWALISRECLGGRYDRRQCALRFRHGIHPNRITGPWTVEEKRKLLTGVEKFGVGKWTEIAKNCFNWTRSDNDIKRVYNDVVDPAIKLGRWTPKEDAKLIKYRTNGLKWSKIAELIGRTASRCLERFGSKEVTDKLKTADT